MSEVEFWAVVVYENTTLSHQVELPKDTDMRNIWIVNMLDLQAIFEFLPTDLSLVKFLRNDEELLNRIPVSCIDYLDRFAYYISNGESYMRAGKYPDWISFSPHSWHYFYHEKLHEKYQDNIYELIECEVPDTFNYVGKQDENLYEIVDKGHLNGGIVVKYDEHLIWILYPNGLEFIEDEAKEYSCFIGPLYADYLVKLKGPLLELFKRYNFNFEKSYRIVIYPASLIERTKELHFLKPHVSQLNKANPLIVITGTVEDSGSIRSAIIYDSQYLLDLFAPQENIGERYCIAQLIKSIVCFFDKNLSREEIHRIAKEFVETNVPLQIKGYSLQKISTLNPKLKEYGRHQEISVTDILRVHRKIGEFLLQSGMKPGEYYGDEAKRLNNLIFKFLQKELENEIRKYNESLLYYAYKEVELVEGQREKKRTQFALDASKYTEYDIVQRNIETTVEIDKVSASAKYIVETILRVGVNGQKSINIESWHYLQAISVVLYETAFISDYIHHDIIPYALRINQLYEIEDIDGQEAYFHKEFYQAKSEREIDQMTQTFIRRNKELESKQTEREVEPFPDILQEIDETFKSQFCFYFSNFVTVLFALGCMDLFDEHRFPLSLVPENELMEKLRESIRDPIDETEVKKILEFASLDFATYEPDDELLPTQLFRRKERLNLCPIIKLPSNEYLYGNQMCFGAMNLWFDSIWRGNLPCNLQNSAIDVALRNLHQYLDRELEKDAEGIAENALGRENIEARIDKFERFSSLLPSRPDCGEIDILAVNKSLKIVYVLDAKNRNPKMRPADIRREIEDFSDGERSYLAQLTKKEKFIRENLDEILKHFSVRDIEGWHVRKAFVVRENYPSAYCPDKNVDFVLIDDLDEYLTQNERGDNGNKHQRAQLYSSEGIFFLQRGDYQDALVSFEKAQNIFMKLELKEMIWQILKYKLECYIEMDNKHDCIENLLEMFRNSYKEELVEKSVKCLIQFVSILVEDFEWEFLSRIVEISSSIDDFDLQYLVEALSEYGKVKLGRASMKDFEVKTSKIRNEDLLDSLDWLVILDPSWGNSWQF